MSTYDDMFMKNQQKPKPATENQIKYFEDLVAGRDWDDEVSQLPPAWQELFLSNVPPNSTPLAQTDVSKFIDLLKTCPRKGRVSSPVPVFGTSDHGVPTAPTNSPAVPADIDLSAYAGKQELADGFYRQKASGDVFKVYHTQRGHQVAKKLVVHGHEGGQAEVEFVYVGKKPLHSLATTDRLTMLEAMEFGKVYGSCMLCGRTLTNELSIALGIGPVCGKREFGGQFQFMVDQTKVNLNGQDYIDAEVVSVDFDDVEAMKVRLAELEAKQNG